MIYLLAGKFYRQSVSIMGGNQDPDSRGIQPAADKTDRKRASSDQQSPPAPAELYLGKRPAAAARDKPEIDHQQVIQETAAKDAAASLALLQARIRELEEEAAANKVHRTSLASSSGCSSRSMSQGSSSSSSQDSLSSVDSAVLAQRILEQIDPSDLSEVIPPSRFHTVTAKCFVLHLFISARTSFSLSSADMCYAGYVPCRSAHRTVGATSPALPSSFRPPM